MSATQLPPHSRVWIYQSSRPFTVQENHYVNNVCQAFVAEWAAHGSKLSAAIEVLHNRFIVVFVDEAVAMASGCSIDKSVRLIKQLEQELKISLTGRMEIAYKEGDEVKTFHLHDLGKMLASGNIHENTLLFDNMVSTKADFDNKWLCALKDSWVHSVKV